MVTVILPSYLYSEHSIDAALSFGKERGVGFVYSYKSRLGDNTVKTDVGMS